MPGRRRRLGLRAVAAVAWVLGGGACVGDRCTRHSDCASGEYCSPRATCEPAPDAAPDAALDAALDAGPDATPPDAAPDDAVTPDASNDPDALSGGDA